ncbi:MDR family oxidoreductase [Candidatus Pelagibacter sp. HIMB109]|uniref:MDR family oxidoreductase n=1 Tax=Candidatus Pelagibacter sp. HIMB109 TaxID=3415412 RepID=UPI003F8269E0
MSFKAIVLNKDGENFTREVKEVEKSFLTHGNVLVKVDYSSLNFKDGMILKNGGNLVKDYPHIPGIDFSGTVEESESGKFKKGDKVILTGWRVGEVFFGGYSQYAKVQDDFLVKMPNDLDSKKAMILGTAGLTALMCVLAIQARETILLGEPIKDVLVTGATGGVGSVAVLALSKLGYNVSAVTGKKDKSGFLKSLGANNIVDRSELDQDARPIDKGLYDGVVDTTGGKILAKALSHTRPNGIVAACGLASSYKLETTVMPFIIRGVKLWGIDSVTAPAKRREFLWSQATTYIDFNQLSEGVQEWGLEDLVQNSSKILKGQISGRVIVNVNK